MTSTRTYLDESDYDRLYVTKFRLAQILASFGFRIHVDKGRWYLQGPARLMLTHTPWVTSDKITTELPPPVPLSPQHTKLWHTLVRYFPGEVSLDHLVGVLEASSRNAVARAMYRLRKCLDESDTPWRISHDKAGHYRLIHLR